MFTEADIDRIGRGVETLALPKSEWTHAAHFAAAMWALTHPRLRAERDMPNLIRAYNTATGTLNTDSGGYHETITLASIRVARAFLDAHPPSARAEALNDLLGSRFGRSDWLLAHFSRERLFSVEARRQWVEPDLTPLPFQPSCP
jgi:hypothetical protein